MAKQHLLENMQIMRGETALFYCRGKTARGECGIIHVTHLPQRE